jgi:hypothetical protein
MSKAPISGFRLFSWIAMTTWTNFERSPHLAIPAQQARHALSDKRPRRVIVGADEAAQFAAVERRAHHDDLDAQGDGLPDRLRQPRAARSVPLRMKGVVRRN